MIRPRDGVIPSPNIWGDSTTYELENLAADQPRVIERAMRRRLAAGASLEGIFLDVGCGTGFHLPRWLEEHPRVVGLEPHAPLARLARDRMSGTSVQVLSASAEAVPLAPGTVAVMHARWAYFFGPGSEPGLAELDRVMRPGGMAFVVDFDVTRSTFGQWFQQCWPDYDGAAVRRFWRRQGWHDEPLDIAWELESEEDFQAVLGLEFPPDAVARIIAEDPGRHGVDVGVHLWSRGY